MPRAGFLAQLGWFVAQGFLDRDMCSLIRREMQDSARDLGQVLNDANKFEVDESKRKVECALVSAETRALVTSRFMTAMPVLAKHFGVELSACEPPTFLIYKPGFFYGRHADANYHPEAPARVRARRVSVSLFLNGEGNEDQPDTYSGGSLTFSGARQIVPNSNYTGIALIGEEGLLLGFHSDWPHEVQPVRRGVRYGIVTWFA
jgi:predicted 2-oxoglutarate/Fe(II)-dependent dioxygenase YbiX